MLETTYAEAPNVWSLLQTFLLVTALSLTLTQWLKFKIFPVKLIGQDDAKIGTRLMLFVLALLLSVAFGAGYGFWGVAFLATLSAAYLYKVIQRALDRWHPNFGTALLSARYRREVADRE